MVRGSDSLVERFFELSTMMCVSDARTKESVVRRTLRTDVVVEPFWREGPRIQTVLKAINDERLASDNDMKKNQLLESGHTLLVDLIHRDAIHEGEVWRRFYETMDVEVGRDRLECRARSLCGHFRGCYVWRTLQASRDDMCSARSNRVRVSNAARRTCER